MKQEASVEFKELPENIQNIAAETLKDLLLDNNQEEPAQMLALRVRKAFVSLYLPEA
ncbi:hypothetical protein LEA60_18660 [Salmonella enterica]|uniref:hypothetical protein n=1 Tax=Salmonella sp. SAL04162 TaxID=3159782 RepID=UPI002A22C81F|nr:hypothetical protein [Salmonella enterica]